MFDHKKLKSNLICILSFLLLLLTSDLFSQEFHPIHYTTKNGLSHDRACHVFQDRDNFMWISTTDGLNHFDGNTFKVYFNNEKDSTSICSNVIGNIQETPNGDLLIGTLSGLALYNKSTKIFSRVFTPPPVKENDNSSGIYEVLVDKKGLTWVCTRHTLYVLGSNYTLIHVFEDEGLKGTNIYRLQCDQNNHIWVNASNHLIEIFYTTSPTNQIQFHTELKKSPFDFFITDFFILKDGTFSILNFEKLYVKIFNRSDTSIIPLPKIFSEYFLRNLFISSQKKVWIYSDGHGAFLWNSDKKEWIHFGYEYQNSHSLCDNIVKDIYEDGDKNLWFCTDHGLDVLPVDQFNLQLKYFYPPNEKTPSFLNSFYMDDSILWVGDWGSSIYKYNLHNESHESFSIGYKGGNHYIFDLMRLGNKIIFGTYDGLFSFSTINHVIRSIESKDQIISDYFKIPQTAFLLTRQGTLLISLLGENGVLMSDTAFSKTIPFSMNKKGEYYFPFRNFTAAVEDNRGNIWAGNNRSYGLAFYDASRKIFKYIDKPFHDIVNCLVIKGDSLWIGSNDGLYLLNINTNQLNKFTRNEGLSCNNINCLAIDGSGELWIGSNNGISLFDITGKYFINFSEIEGLPENEINSLAYNAKSHEIIGLTPHSVFHFNYSGIYHPQQSSIPSITTLRIMGREVYMNLRQPIIFDRNDKIISFEFTVPRLISNHNIHYAYKLEGYDKNWFSTGTRQLASFSNLPPGHYFFHVKASSDLKHWYLSSFPVSFSVQAAFYERSWFIKLLIVVFLLLVLGATVLYYRIKVRRIFLLMKVRNRIASDLHDNIGSSLSSISYLSEIAKVKSTQNPEEIKSIVTQIGENARGLINDMGDIVWSINPKNDEAGNLISRMRNFSSQLLEMKNIELKFEVDEEIENHIFNMDQRRNLYLIFKEIINNIFKHSNCTHVNISFKVLNNQMILEINDNGVGFSSEMKKSGNGLINIKMRANEIGAVSYLKSLPGKGTIFWIKLKTA